MSSIIVATLTYSGALLVNQVKTSPWSLSSVQFPGYGCIPTAPQFDGDTLQPDNVDGARYRVNGAHFIQFPLVFSIAAADFPSARAIANDLNRIRKQSMTYQGTPVFQASEPAVQLQVIEARAMANAGRILGASVGPVAGAGGPPGGGAAPTSSLASVDAVLLCQVYLP